LLPSWTARAFSVTGAVEAILPAIPKPTLDAKKATAVKTVMSERSKRFIAAWTLEISTGFASPLFFSPRHYHKRVANWYQSLCQAAAVWHCCRMMHLEAFLSCVLKKSVAVTKTSIPVHRGFPSGFCHSERFYVERDRTDRSYHPMQTTRACNRRYIPVIRTIVLVLGIVLALTTHQVGMAAEVHQVVISTSAVDGQTAHCPGPSCRNHHPTLPCCAMGLCLLGLPVQNLAMIDLKASVAHQPGKTGLASHPFPFGIDRPPKAS